MPNSTLEMRRDQMFPVLEPNEVERLRRFGTVVAYAEGDSLFRAGEIGLGMFIILKGNVAVSRKDALGHAQLIVEEGAGAFLAELNQLSGRPALVDAHAKSAVEALVVPAERLRALLIAEAELGEQIMRALILRRVGLIEEGAGPIIVGRAAQAGVLRMQGFLARNGQPYHHLDPDIDEVARALIEHFHITEAELPIVICPDGQLLRDQSEPELARNIGMVARIDPDRVYDVAIVGAGPAGLANRLTCTQAHFAWTYSGAGLSSSTRVARTNVLSSSVRWFTLAEPRKLLRCSVSRLAFSGEAFRTGGKTPLKNGS